MQKYETGKTKILHAKSIGVYRWEILKEMQIWKIDFFSLFMKQREVCRLKFDMLSHISQSNSSMLSIRLIETYWVTVTLIEVVHGK